MSKPLRKKTKFPVQQSDITITKEGTVFVSFLWGDLIGKVPAETLLEVPVFPKLKIDKEAYKSCRLCPKECGFNRNESAHPTCGDWQLRVSNVGLSLGDEPMIRGERGSGTVLLSGCPLRCPSCHNPEMVQQGRPMSPNEFLEVAWGLMEEGAHNLQILSPTVHLPALQLALTELRKTNFNIPVILKSSGYEKISELAKLEGLVDVYLPDFKFGSCSSWGDRAGASDYFSVTIRAILEMWRQVGACVFTDDGLLQRGVLVRHVRAPLPLKEKAEIEKLLSTLPTEVSVSYSDNFVELE